MKYSKFTYIFSIFKYTIIACPLLLASCNSSINNKDKTTEKAAVVNQDDSRDQDLLVKRADNQPVPAAELIADWAPDLKGKRVGIVGNQTSVVRSNQIVTSKEWDKKERVRYTHLVDTLLTYGVEVTRVFAPEHGFRGTADAGATIKDGFDEKTGLPIISLYGENKKPTAAQLEGIEIMIFDIQDVGARFYTYISTLHYVMEACAENNIPLLILDRPNPNGHYYDGPILEKEHVSFVGMHPVPVVHGLTIGEYATMINGEGWLEKGVKVQMEIIKCTGYTHDTPYSVPIKPSPNLPNDQSINLYPSLCFFEGTEVSVGRGTDMQFQVYGSPSLVKYIGFSFTPTPNPGAKRPKFNGKRCFGVDLRNYEKLDRLNLDFVVDAFAKASYTASFFNPFFTKLAGTETLQEQIIKGMTADEISATWQKGLVEYGMIRDQYLLYP
jgi:uncharacterized protein YbbC (DUF1343 family)